MKDNKNSVPIKKRQHTETYINPIPIFTPMRKALTLATLVTLLTGGCTDTSSIKNQSKQEVFCPNPYALTDIGPLWCSFEDKSITYDTLVDMVRENDGELSIDMETTKVGRDKERPLFDRSGFGYAWSEEMYGCLGDDIPVKLRQLNVGRETYEQVWEHSAFGYAWTNVFAAEVGGNPFTLVATRAQKEEEIPSLSHRGFGFGHTLEMEGTFGDSLRVTLTTTETHSEKDDPGHGNIGYGYGWMQQAQMTIYLDE